MPIKAKIGREKTIIAVLDYLLSTFLCQVVCWVLYVYYYLILQITPKVGIIFLLAGTIETIVYMESGKTG